MRQLFQEQLSLSGPTVNHRHARELDGVDRILQAHPDISVLVLQDLEAGLRRPHEGREGMSAEQVLRAAVVMRLNTFTYEDLSFHLADSVTYRAFCGYGLLDEVPSKSTLQRNIKAITEETWQEIQLLVLDYAAQCGVEHGRTVRTDGTVTETDVHPPTDSSLLWDSVRVLTRLVTEAREAFGVSRFPSRARRAKRRALDVLNAKKPRKRVKAYRDLLKVTKETVGYAQEVVAELEACPEVRAHLLAAEMTRNAGLAEQVIDQTERRVLDGESVPAVDQTERRVLDGESVPAEEKVVSIFEPHTDIIKKEKRKTHYGHKLTVTAGRSGLSLDWVVEDGNPADSTLAVRTIERQREIYGRVPRQAAFDGGYASKANLKEIKKLGVQDVVFSKKRGLEVEEMARSAWVYKRLRNFRAGIEGWISFLKRAFGLERCTWRGEAGFARYVGSSIVAANLLTLARHLMT